MPYYEFLWTNDIVRHLAEHGISQDDFERVVCNPSSRGYSRSSGLPVAWGHTQDGRYIVAIYEELDQLMLLPVTALKPVNPIRWKNVTTARHAN